MQMVKFISIFFNITFGRWRWSKYYTPSPQLHVQDSSSWLCCSCQRSIHNSKYIFAEQQHLLVHHVHWRTFEARTQDMQMIGLSLENVPHQDFASRKLSILASFKGSVLTALLHCKVFLYHFTLTILSLSTFKAKWLMPSETFCSFMIRFTLMEIDSFKKVTCNSYNIISPHK